jgi:hypothetical protein
MLPAVALLICLIVAVPSIHAHDVAICSSKELCRPEPIHFADEPSSEQAVERVKPVASIVKTMTVQLTGRATIRSAAQLGM